VAERFGSGVLARTAPSTAPRSGASSSANDRPRAALEAIITPSLPAHPRVVRQLRPTRVAIADIPLSSRPATTTTSTKVVVAACDPESSPPRHGARH
jgi:hypothetical protein